MLGFELYWCSSLRYFYCPKSFSRSHSDEYVTLSSDVLRTECFLELTACTFSLSLPAPTEMYGNSNGSVPATFQIYYMIGWKYHESQVMWSCYFLFEGTDVLKAFHKTSLFKISSIWFVCFFFFSLGKTSPARFCNSFIWRSGKNRRTS